MILMKEQGPYCPSQQNVLETQHQDGLVNKGAFSGAFFVLGTIACSPFDRFKHSESQRSASEGQQVCSEWVSISSFFLLCLAVKRMCTAELLEHPGTLVGQRHGKYSCPGVPPRGKTILLPHSSTAPTSPEGKKDPLCFLKSNLAFKDPPEIRPDRNRTVHSLLPTHQCDHL